jgi:hypothetical protein
VAGAENEDTTASRIGKKTSAADCIGGPLLKKRENWRTPIYYGSRFGEVAHPPVRAHVYPGPTTEQLIEQILSPLIIRMPHQAHDVAAGVEIEGTRLAGGPHVGFVRKLIAFAAVAAVATGDEVLPGGKASARARDDVVEGELSGRKIRAAILTGVAVAQQDVLTR